MLSHFLKVPLQEALDRTNKQQKFVATDTKTPNATFSDHVKGKQPVNIKKALQYAKSIDDSKFYMEVAHIYLGTPILMDDAKYNMDILSLNLLSEKEEYERKQVFDDNKLILAAKEESWGTEERDSILKLSMELLDEITVKLTLLTKLLDTCQLTLPEAVKMRSSYLEKKKYIKKKE